MTTHWIQGARWRVGVLAPVLVIGLVVPSADGAPSADVAPASRPGTESPILTELNGGSHTVTLITGDRIMLEPDADGNHNVTVERAPRADGSIPNIEVTQSSGEGIYAWPADAQPYVDAGLLDEELFNVGYLVANGYADEASGQLPVIVEYAGSHDVTARGPADSLAATASRTVTLQSINATGMSVDKTDAAAFWESMTDGPAATELTARTASLPGDVERIWLDRMSYVELDDSVPQIGAPTAWDAGYDGTGVTVAVLDTGIDAAHPDVAGKVVASQSFVFGQDVPDGSGHGTHVAATLAGAGAASSGQYTGVAPGAELAVGKVCNNSGGCLDSSVIAGMQWAALDQGADVVSMSLGGCCSDGADPMSQAVNQLTDQTGALFVIAAGNNGPTIASPGTAAAALTVGAVDKSDHLAGLSNRGPVQGSYALKPEITAPGIDIVAARAAGTSLGNPVDDDYTAISGTSMATPHVAGAAAILAQQHPDWEAVELKAALVATAEDGGYTVYEQGAGRLDVGRAVTQQVQVQPATADFGLFEWPQEGPPATTALTYSNPTEAPVTLDLAATVSTDDGAPIPDGAVTLDQDTLAVPAAGAAAVTVTVDHTVLDQGVYTGKVVATGDDASRLTTPVGFVVEEERFPVTVRITHSADQYAFATGGVTVRIGALDAPDSFQTVTFNLSRTTNPAFTAQVDLPAGTYDVRADSRVQWNDLTTGRRQQAFLVAPEVVVTEETEVVLDASQAERVAFDTPRPSEPFQDVIHHYQRWAPETGRASMVSIWSFVQDSWASPTEEVETGELLYSIHTGLSAPLVTMEVLGTGGRDVHAQYTDIDETSPPLGDRPIFDGTQTLSLVDAGTGTPEELAEVDVAGKLALLRRDPVADPPRSGELPDAGCWPRRAAAERVAAAGAAGILLVQNEWAAPPHDPGSTAGCAIRRGIIRPGYGVDVPTLYAPLADAQFLRGQLADSDVSIKVQGQPVTPYLYTLKPYWHDGIPESLQFTFNGSNLAVVDHSFHESVGVQPANDLSLSTVTRKPQQDGFVVAGPVWNQLRRGVVLDLAPWRVTEYVGPLDPEAVWRQRFRTHPTSPAFQEYRYAIFDAPTRTSVGWNDSPPVPAAAPQDVQRFGTEACAACRQGNTLWPGFRYSLSSDPAIGESVHGRAPHDPMVRLYRDEVEIAQTPFTYFPPLGGPQSVGAYELPPEPARYRLTHRLAPTATTPQQVDTAWEFTSGSVLGDDLPDDTVCTGTSLEAFGFPPDTPCRAEALIFLRYDLGLDLSNRAEAPGAHRFEVTAYHRPSATDRPDIAGMKLWTSTDGGQEWRKARVRPLGEGRFEAIAVYRPAPRRASDAVRVKVEAWDADGNRVEQEISDAWTLRPSS